MAKCNNFPKDETVYILDNKPAPTVYSCKKKTKDKYLCDGSINDGFWKLQRDKDEKCRWYKCIKPFTLTKDGKIDDSDYSDCIITNFPYYIKNTGTRCRVFNIYGTGRANEGCGGSNNTQCCKEGNVCNNAGCFRYKTLDKYLIDQSLDYKCDGESCIRTDQGKGDYSNPYCDYQCSSLFYPTDFACINGYCQKINNKGAFPEDTKYYDNPYCDLNCPPSDNVSFNCADGNCVSITGKGGKYKDFIDCYKDCEQVSETPTSAPTSMFRSSIFLISIIIFNIIIIYLIFYLFFMRRKNK